MSEKTNNLPENSAKLLKIFNNKAAVNQQNYNKKYIKDNNNYDNDLEHLVKLRTMELQRRELLYHKIINTTSEGFWRIDAEKNTVEVNDSLVNMTGYNREEFLKLKILDIIPSEEEELMAKNLSQRSTTLHRTYPMTLLKKNGQRLPVIFNASSLFDDRGNLIGSFAFITNIQEQKRKEKALQEAKQETEKLNKKLRKAIKKIRQLAIKAQKASNAKSAFLARMSHEIRTPMNAIIGFADQTLQTKLDQEQKNFLNIVHTSALHLLEIINDILDFSKVEAGKTEIINEPFSLHRFIKKICDEMSILAKARKIALDINIDDRADKYLVGDQAHLRQVLINLIGNAIKFTDQGKVNVSITVQNKIFKENEDYIYLKFKVKDTGRGIAEEKLNYIFEAFNQADSSLTRKEGGTGLGLAISANLVELMGGNKIKVESKLGNGSTFSFDLPFIKATAQQINEISNHKSFKTEPEKGGCNLKKFEKRPLSILVVDDIVINRLLVKHIIEKKGCMLKEAENGQQALDMLDQETFDIVLMDIEMPVMDGINAVIKLREKEKNRGSYTPVIAMTAHAIKGYKEKLIEAGMDDYITKPISPDAVFDTIKKHLINSDLNFPT